jgi:non-homologous end joining protein Ku
MRVIQARVKGRRVKLGAPEEPQQAEAVDLVERLRRSLEQPGGPGKRTSHAAKPKRAASSARRARKTRAA